MRVQEQKLKEDHYNVIAYDDDQIMAIINEISKETDILFEKNKKLNSWMATHSETLKTDIKNRKQSIS